MTAMAALPASAIPRLYNAEGRRTYLTPRERARFLERAKRLPLEDRTLCETLIYTGARCSEVTLVRAHHIDFENHTIALVCLKKRRTGVYRTVPVPPGLVDSLSRMIADKPGKERVWPVSRWTVYRRVIEVMTTADIDGPHATVRGLRHAFGIHAVNCGVPLNLISRWMGHASLETTSIYLNAIGAEELAIAARMW